MFRTVFLLIACITNYMTLAQIQFNKALVLNPESIMQLTSQNNGRIKAAYFKSEAAKSNFKLFEREYTSFNPLVLNGNYNTNADHINQAETSIGMEKEFFDGSSVGVYSGSINGWGQGPENINTQYIESKVSFPLFTSNRKLSRLIKRTFEENELYSAKLDYVNAVRENILNALEMYYDFVPRYKMLKMYEKYKYSILSLINNDSLRNRTNDIRQLMAETNSLQSDITNFEITVNSLRINMQRWMNVDSILFEQVQPIFLDFSKATYLGEFYINAPSDSIICKALKNDTEFKVLQLMRANAEEKKKMAQRGKWDIFLNLGTRYNLYDMQAGNNYSKYWLATSGIQIKRFDQKTLDFTVQKALSDIASIESTISDRKKEISTEVTIRKETLLKKQEQLLNTNKSLEIWLQNYSIKLKAFIAGTESADNLLQAFRSMVNTEKSWYEQENNYFDTIRDLDYVCGVYFEYLNIDLNN